MNRRKFIKTTVALLPASILYSHRVDSEPVPTTEEVPWLFVGYDAVLGESRQRCVEGKFTHKGPEQYLVGTVCTDYRSLIEKLEVDQSMSAGFTSGSIGGSISKKSQMVKQLDLTEYSVSVVVAAQIVKKTITAVEYTVNVPHDFSKPDALQDFVKKYGNAFIYEVALGGYFYAVYSFNASCSSEKTQVIDSLKASGTYDGFTLDASGGSNLSTAIQTIKTQMSFRSCIDGFELTIPTTPSDIVTFAASLPSKTISDPAVVSMKSRGIENAFSEPDSRIAAPLVKTRELFCDSESGILRRVEKATALKNQCDRLADIYKFYRGFRDWSVISAAALAGQDLFFSHELISKYRLNPVAELTPADERADYSMGLPSLAFTRFDGPQAGGNGGTPFDDIPNLEQLIQNCTWISKIVITGEYFVKKLTVTYQDKNGNVRTETHGTDTGKDHIATFETSDLFGMALTSSGWVGRNLDIQVVSRLGLQYSRLISGEYVGMRFGLDGPGTVMTSSFIEGNLIGFTGKAAAWLDNINLVSFRFKEATWNTV